MSLTGKNNAEKIWNFLKAKGLSDCGIAGLMGNLYAESGLEPTNLQNSYESALGFTDDSYTAAVDKGAYSNFTGDAAGYGLAQWTYWTRKRDLLAFAQAAGCSVGDLETQLNYLWKELTESYTGVLKVLKTASTIKEASDKVLTEFERPADMGNAVKTRRAGYGQRYYEDYAIQSGSDAAPETEEPAEAETTGNGRTVKRLLAIAVAEIGYKEKESNSQLDSATANAGDDNYTKYARDLAKAGYYQASKQGYAWCDVFVDWLFLQLCDGDADAAQAMICQTGPYGAGCNFSRQYYQQQGRLFSNPKAGDQIFFKNSAGEITHTGIVESVTATKVNTIEGNTSNRVARRSYALGDSGIAKYGRPKYDEDDTDDATTTEDKAEDTTGDSYTAAELKVGDIVTFTGSKHYKSANASRGYACKAGKAKITAIHQLGTSKHPYHLIATDGSESTVYGWVDEDCIAEAVEQAEAEPWTPAVGDLVNFTGNRHYLWVNASTGPSCKPGLARITSIYMPGKTKHPYHLVAASGGGSNVYGWVDEGTFTKA